MENNSRLVTDLRALKFKYNNPVDGEQAAIKPAVIKPEIKTVRKPEAADTQDNSIFLKNLSQERLQEAVIWSEILGKPVSKRGKRK